MILAIHQLHYLPWLRYFHKIASADVFVVLDNIQFNKNGWQNRNKIKTDQGELILTVPIFHKMGQTLAEVEIDNKQPWRRKHWGAISNHYHKAPFFKEHETFLQGIYEREWRNLNDLNYEMLFYFLKALGVKTPVMKSSEMNLCGEATERLVHICKGTGADTYLTGAFAAQEYLDERLFAEAGIALRTHEFECPVYPQAYPERGFVPELSILDLLCHCGSETLSVLMSGKAQKIP